MAIAREWEMPHYIVNTINPYNKKINSKRLHLTDEEKMHAISSLSNELTVLIEKNDDGEDWRQKSVKLWRQYTPQLHLKDRDLTGLADQAKKDLIDLNSILNINMSKSSIIQGLDNEEIDKTEYEKTDYEKTMLLESGKKSADVEQGIVIEPDSKPSQDVSSDEEKIDTQTILTAGIDEIGAKLMASYSVTDIFRECLDVMHQAFKFDHSIVCMVNNNKKVMEARFGHGINNAFLEQFQFPLKYQPDVFHLALDKSIEIFIADTTDEKIIKKIPAWYQQIIEAESFIVLPVMIKKKPIGLFYGDRFNAGELVVKQSELKLLQKLKFLAAEALIKKSQR